MEEQLNIETIIEFIKQEKIYWTNHSLNRLHQRNILVTDVNEMKKLAIEITIINYSEKVA